jgi:hypothetical protein
MMSNFHDSHPVYVRPGSEGVKPERIEHAHIRRVLPIVCFWIAAVNVNEATSREYMVTALKDTYNQHWLSSWLCDCNYPKNSDEQATVTSGRLW